MYFSKESAYRLAKIIESADEKGASEGRLAIKYGHGVGYRLQDNSIIGGVFGVATRRGLPKGLDVKLRGVNYVINLDYFRRKNGKLLIGYLADYLYDQINKVLKQQEQVYEKAYKEYEMRQVRELYKEGIVNNKQYNKNKHNSPEIEDNGLGL